jgi:hypothetical protein
MVWVGQERLFMVFQPVLTVVRVPQPPVPLPG